MPKVSLVAGQGCMLSGIGGLIDALTIANLWHQALCKEAPVTLFKTEIVTSDGRPVCTNGGIQLLPDRSIHDVECTDLVFVPPFLLPRGGGFDGKTTDLTDWIVAQYDRQTPIAASCTGVFLLAETGLLDGKIATTNWQFGRLFQHRYPKVRLRLERILTEDRRLICTGAATALFNLALHVIRMFGSEELACVCSKALLVDPSRDSQAPYVIPRSQRNHGDADILKAQQWMEGHYAENFPIDTVARRVGISPRHFKRRFKKATGELPLGYVQRLRIEEAKKKLETTRENMEEITCGIGYDDASSFRRLFKKHTGLSPREYRDKFRQH